MRTFPLAPQLVIIRNLQWKRTRDRNLWLDAGYVGKEDVATKCGMNPIICEKDRYHTYQGIHGTYLSCLQHLQKSESNGTTSTQICELIEVYPIVYYYVAFSKMRLKHKLSSRQALLFGIKTAKKYAR